MKHNLSSYPNRIDILKTLTSKDALKYSELKSLAGYRSRKNGSMFVEHLIKLLRQSLISLNKHERTYSVTILGRTSVINSLKTELKECL